MFWEIQVVRAQIASLFHPQTDDISEQVIQTIKQKILSNQTPINIYYNINTVVSGINLSLNIATGISPVTLRESFRERIKGEEENIFNCKIPLNKNWRCITIR
jgi:hypothetical protein